MSDDVFPPQNENRGHRNSVAIEDDDEFGLRQRLSSLRKPQYWAFIAVFAVGFTIFSYGWQNYWLPEKPIAWKPWSKFHAEHALSLKRPLLIRVSGGPVGGNRVDDERTPASKLEDFLQELDSADFRKAFHLRSGQALLVSAETEDRELLWLFKERPISQTLWLATEETPPRSIDWRNASIEQMLKLLSE